MCVHHAHLLGTLDASSIVPKKATRTIDDRDQPLKVHGSSISTMKFVKSVVERQLFKQPIDLEDFSPQIGPTTVIKHRRWLTINDADCRRRPTLRLRNPINMTKGLLLRTEMVTLLFLTKRGIEQE